MTTHLHRLEPLAEPRLGVDIGRVLIDGGNHVDTSFFGRDAAAIVRTPEVEGAIDAVARLVPLFSGRVWLVSKCGPGVQARSRAWLLHQDFHRRTGIPQEHLRFCRERREKAGICAELGLTHFVDDRDDIIASLQGLVSHRFHFGARGQSGEPSWHRVPTWAVAERAIRATL